VVKRLLTSLAMIVVVALGVFGGVQTAIFSMSGTTYAFSFDDSRVSIVSWRGRGDLVPHTPTVQWDGWAGPMFYTTSEEGNYPGLDAGGKRPTGPWAPGDKRDRVLTIKNVDRDFVLRLEGIDAVLYGAEELAPWFEIDVRSPRNQIVYVGTMAELALHQRPFVDTFGKTNFLVMPGYSEEHLLFTITMRPDTPWYLQGKTLRVDFRIHASPHQSKP